MELFIRMWSVNVYVGLVSIGFVVSQDCYTDTRTYSGTTSVTVSGKTCQRWDSQWPHQHKMPPDNFPEFTKADPQGTYKKAENYCRDADKSGFLWCFTSDPNVQWEKCAVQLCKQTDCYTDSTTYEGTTSVTASGKTCQRWDSQSPHVHEMPPANFPEFSKADPSGTYKRATNYCRDADRSGFLWCYTTDPNVQWERCSVQRCKHTDVPKTFHCKDKPCLNGGTCQDSNGLCICPQGMTGYDCREDINECSTYRCLNGGTCVNAVGSYDCLCTRAWEGEHCELARNLVQKQDIPVKADAKAKTPRQKPKPSKEIVVKKEKLEKRPFLGTPVVNCSGIPDGFYPDPRSKDCRKFARCFQGNFYNYNCNPIHLFHPMLEVCVWPHEYTCIQYSPSIYGVPYEKWSGAGDRATGVQDKSTSASGKATGTAKQPTVPVTTTVRPNLGKAVSNCTGFEDGFYADPKSKNCKKFVRCIKGHLYRYKCQKALLFNPWIEVCVWPRQYTCEQS